MRIVCLILVLFLTMSSSCNAKPISGTNTPEVLSDKLERLRIRTILTKEEFLRVYEAAYETLTEDEWEELAGYMVYISQRGEAAEVAVKLCNLKSQGSYCDEAAEDIKIIEDQFLKAEKLSGRFESVKRDPKNPGSLDGLAQ